MRLILSTLLLLASPVMAQQSDGEAVEAAAEAALRQPLKDFGITSDKAPALLLAAQADPYGLKGLKGCADYRRAIADLNEVLGPDVDMAQPGRPLSGRLAEAGAGAALGAVIPFRGLVREATGAAETERRLRATVIAGGARRSFLKGYAKGRGCRV